MAAPVLAMKPNLQGTDQDIKISASREWTLPPKPKPGRKPTNDSAPTKRKAQNRDAQRAFRERRAARVGELEQQIRDINAEHRAALEVVEIENGRLKGENYRLRESIEKLSKELDSIRSLTRLSQSPVHSRQTTDAGTPHVQQTASPAPSDQAVSPAYKDNTLHGQSVPLRRKRQGNQSAVKRLKIDDNKFNVEAFRPPGLEACGFCSDGTPCLCAEAAKDEADRATGRFIDVARMIENCKECAQPLPCFCDEVAKVQTRGQQPVIADENGLCTGNPGSCRRCQIDPLSSVFCNKLAEAAERPLQSTRPLLPRTNTGFSTSSARESTPPNKDEYLPCSAAYTTIAQHSNFSSYKGDIGTLVEALKVDTEKGRGVERASVRDVLRLLDRGLGRG